MYPAKKIPKVRIDTGCIEQPHSSPVARDLCCMACGVYKAIGFSELVMGTAMADSQAAGAELDEMASATQRRQHWHSR